MPMQRYKPTIIEGPSTKRVIWWGQHTPSHQSRNPSKLPTPQGKVQLYLCTPLGATGLFFRFFQSIILDKPELHESEHLRRTGASISHTDEYFDVCGPVFLAAAHAPNISVQLATSADRVPPYRQQSARCQPNTLPDSVWPGTVTPPLPTLSTLCTSGELLSFALTLLTHVNLFCVYVGLFFCTYVSHFLHLCWPTFASMLGYFCVYVGSFFESVLAIFYTYVGPFFAYVLGYFSPISGHAWAFPSGPGGPLTLCVTCHLTGGPPETPSTDFSLTSHNGLHPLPLGIPG